MRQLWRRAFESPAARIGLGLAIGQGAIFISTPWLTRLYGPEAFGVMTVGLAIAGICATFGTLRVELLIPRLDESELANATRFSSLTLFAASLLGALAMYLSTRAGLLESALVGAVTFFLGGAAIYQQSRIRRNALGRIGSAKAAQGLGQVVAQGGFALVSPTGAGLVGGLVAGYGCAFALLRAPRPRPNGDGSVAAFGRQNLRQMIRLTLSATLNSITVAFLPLLLSYQFGTEATGQFSVVQRLALVPVGLVLAALSPVIIATVSARLRTGKPTSVVVKTWIRRLSIVGAVAGAALVVVPQSWVAALLGAGFSASHAYFAPLAPMIASQLVCGPLSTLLAIFRRDRLQLIWDACRFAAVASVGVALGAMSHDPIVTVLGISVVITVFYVVYLVLLLRATRKSDTLT
ncbi:lipopolysaccharide biosynthesis protein [Citricoccus sp. SGAir0253]|uniref:lipopolysaccharide biosynthesis protein n=1 Tax=Citricoccus sp. SGAir0253 TaxID=2567881 RepID=UPI00143DBE7C|nr:oligosaccharide flippase family protein [Citricoccus sp. SGAir0253]